MSEPDTSAYQLDADGTRQHLAITTDGEHDIDTRVTRRDLRGELYDAWLDSGELLRLKQLSAATTIVAWALIRLAEPKGEGRYLVHMPSEDELHEQTGLGRSSIYKAVKLIQAARLMSDSRLQKTPDGKRRVWLYRSIEDHLRHERDPQADLFEDDVQAGARAGVDSGPTVQAGARAGVDSGPTVQAGARAGVDSGTPSPPHTPPHPRANTAAAAGGALQIEPDEPPDTETEARRDALVEAEIGPPALPRLAARPELTPAVIREVAAANRAAGGRGGLLVRRLEAKADALAKRAERAAERAGERQRREREQAAERERHDRERAEEARMRAWLDELDDEQVAGLRREVLAVADEPARRRWAAMDPAELRDNRLFLAALAKRVTAHQATEPPDHRRPDH